MRKGTWKINSSMKAGVLSEPLFCLVDRCVVRLAGITRWRVLQRQASSENLDVLLRLGLCGQRDMCCVDGPGDWRKLRENKHI